MRVVLVDGDAIVYRAGFASEHRTWKLIIDGVTKEFSDKKSLNEYVLGLPTAEKRTEDLQIESVLDVEPVEHCLQTVKMMLSEIMYKTKADVMRIYLSGSRSFREDLCTILPYKANRWSHERMEKEREGKWAGWLKENEHKLSAQPKPRLYGEIRKYLQEVQGATIPPNDLEADDALSIDAFRLMEMGDTPIVATHDKDLDMIPCEHFMVHSKEQYHVLEEDAIGLFFKQCLTGDATDNIPGIKGVGPVTADKILANCSLPQEYYEKCLAAWSDYLWQIKDGDFFGPDPAYWLHEVATLLWMNRDKDMTPWYKALEISLYDTAPAKMSAGLTWSEKGKVKIDDKRINTLGV